MRWPETTVEQARGDLERAGRRLRRAMDAYDLERQNRAERDVDAARARLDAVLSQQPDRQAFRSAA